MGELQWALLIVCVVLVIALYVFSRRGKQGGSAGAEDGETPAAGTKQTDLFAPPPGDFDEFGVGRPRSRAQEAAARAAAGSNAVPPSVASLLEPLPGQAAARAPAPVARSAPGLGAPNAPQPAQATAAVPATAPAPPAAPALNSTPSSKLVVLIVAPTEETDILGPQLHQALAAQGLRFGEGEVYHRLIGGRIVYSVAGLLKPGKLIPAEAESFSTRGLTVVMHLPGPVKAEVALDDMLSTTRALAAALKADIFNQQRERLADDTSAALRAEVQDWARTQKTA